MARAMPQAPGLLRAYAGLLALVVCACIFAQSARGADIEEQRATFLKAYAAAQMGDASWRAWSESLRDYPLYPYLQAALLEHNLHRATVKQVSAYLERYHGLIPAEDLRRNYLLLLARRKDWNDFRALYRPGFGDTLACYALQARLARGERLDFKRDLADLWREASLPSACDKVQIRAHEQGLLTTARLWQRIESAADARRGATIAWLARWLPHKDAIVARRMSLALRRPASATRDARHWPDTARNREAAMLAITELARGASESAVDAWPDLRRHFHFSDATRNRILRTLALYRAYNFGDDALDRLAALPEEAENDASREWRVRIALAERNSAAALAALDALSDAQKKERSWRYLRGRVLEARGEREKAEALFAGIADSATYYGFLAADRLGAPYVICPHSTRSDVARERTVLAYPGFARAFELFAVGLLRDARREWARASEDADADTRRLAADLAFRRGWYSRAIFTFSHGDWLHRYHERFPLAYERKVNVEAEANGLDPAWVDAVIRAESAWIPDAGSHAGARGLMQLMPSTARGVARRHDIRYRGNLFIPRINIILGTRYLAQVAARYNGSPWLASIAYNAGPGRVDDWLDARGQLAPDLFIVTIPFGETRRYVIRVMAYSVVYGWRLHGDETLRLSRRMTPYGEVHAPPSATTPRVAVICPPPATAAPATSTPGPPAASGSE